jgi:Protein of unknown function (DUF1592)/Protein of unknown function (DUF1588)/Protein of unknown function (DUF1587)/Protein of unknown function (DUF1585)/Protein of unknown function (DUF1595)
MLVLVAALGACGVAESNGTPVHRNVPPADAGSMGGDAGTACGAPALGSSPFRRMTRKEYNNTVRDLLGDATNPATAFPPDEVALGFDNGTSARGVTFALAEQYMLAAEQIAVRAVTHIGTLLPCDPSTTGEASCADLFIRTFASRAYRRPLELEEIASLQHTFDTGRSGGTFAAGIEHVIERVLQAPAFLYRLEFGSVDAASTSPVPLTSFELASRLSYFLWESMPDTALFDAASSGRLSSKADVLAQARRMIADGKARAAVADFNDQWLELGKLDWIVKDSITFPNYQPDLPPIFKEETRTFVDDVIWNGQGDLATLLTAPYSFANARTAPLYGVGPLDGDVLVRVDLDPTKRAGILTQLGFLSAAAKPNQTSPVRRGFFVRTNLLCDTLPPPPPNANAMVPDPTPGQTGRQRFAVHTAIAGCAACHSEMDPIGFGFEHYDDVGQWRDTEGDQPVDDSGEVVGDAIGKFQGVVDLAQKLARSTDVRRCFATEWFRFAFGREVATSDTCSLGALDEALASSGGNVQALLLAITQTDAFLYKAPTSP